MNQPFGRISDDKSQVQYATLQLLESEMVSCFSKNAISCRNSGSGILSHNDVQGNLQPSRSDLRKVVMLDASEKPTPPHLSVLPSPFQSRSWVLPGIQPVSSENSGYLFESKRRSAEASKQNHAKGNRVYKFLDFAATFVDNMYCFFCGVNHFELPTPWNFIFPSTVCRM